MRANFSGNINTTDFGYKLFTGSLIKSEIRDIKQLKFCKPHNYYGHPTVSSDGLTIIFSSGTRDRQQLYESKRKTLYHDWSAPEPVNELNSLAGISTPKFINDSLLTFSAFSMESPNNYDIFKASKSSDGWNVNGAWSELNSKWRDFGLEMVDSISGYFSSGRNGETVQIYYFRMD